MTIKNELILNQANWPARDQGLRPTCVAFALSELNLVAADGIQALSPEYLYQGAALRTPTWIPYAGVPLGAALAAAIEGQPPESGYPYQPVEPSCPVPPLPKGLTRYGTKIQLSKPDPSQIMEVLRRNKPMGLGLRLTNSFYTPVDGIVADEAVSQKNVLHAVAIVGLGWIDSDPYFLIRNSWGTDWGLVGNAWLSSHYIDAHSICVLEVLNG